MMPERINPLFLACILQSFPGIVFPLPQNRLPGVGTRVTYWRHQTRRASFYVVAQAHPFFGLRCLYLSPCQIMVVRAGQPSGWPVSNKAGIPTPVRVTTHERRNSGGGIYRDLLEVALMATILAPSHPQFIFVFAAVRRAERKPRISMLRIVASNEHHARLSLVHEYVLCLAARLPVREVM